MFGRQVTIMLKANSASELTRLLDNDIIPILRKQKGFRDETTFVAPERSEVIANSFWDTKEDAEAYNRSTYPEVLKTLSNVIEGTPTVKNFEFANSTFHKAAAARFV
jgi:heme-degrading monooxygenase HmoA